MEMIAGAFGLELTEVVLGLNRRGKEVTSCVVTPISGTTAQRPHLTQRDRLFFDALMNYMAVPGIIESVRPQANYPLLNTVRIKGFETYLIRNGFLEAETDGRLTRNHRQKKHEVLNSLRSKGYTGMTDTYVWRVS